MSRILIIEDEEHLRESIAEFLEYEGFKCLQAPDGIEGIEIARAEMPDMIICDIRMPGLNGHEVLKELRRDSRTSSIPFIFLTALIDKSDLRQGMNLGADDYLTKPFLNEDLLSAIKTRLDKSSEILNRFNDLRKSIAHKLPHELRTPIVSIIGYSQLLIDRYKDENDPTLLEYSKAIYDAGIRLNKMIQNFLLFTKLKLASAAPKFKDDFYAEPTLLSASLIKSIAENIALRYGRVNDLSFKGTDGVIKISLNEFNIILEELIDNAFKFSAVKDKVEIESIKTSKNYTIRIKNYGRGMSEDQIKSIDAYVQFDREQYEQQGIGLGLTISSKLVEAYGGNFKINSKQDEFTEIILEFASVDLKDGLNFQ
ncbi:MAG: response regulator [Ignavibacterium sp.]|nr:response regulator [Ignavibacterium sp.]